jgi:hypothetical protein
MEREKEEWGLEWGEKVYKAFRTTKTLGEKFAWGLQSIARM